MYIYSRCDACSAQAAGCLQAAAFLHSCSRAQLPSIPCWQLYI